MKTHYVHVSHLHDKLKVKVSIELRDRSSKSSKIKGGERKRKTLETVKNTYSGEIISKNILWYGGVSSVLRKYRKVLYLGKRGEVVTTLGEILDEDISEKPDNYLKRELKLLLIQYTRYKVFNSDWKSFTSTTHNLESILEWVYYCREHNTDRTRWGSWSDI